MLKIYNDLCGPDLELNLFTQNKKVEGSASESMLSAYVPPPTTEKAMHVFPFSNLADFILIDF